jgi:hypothetical protein
MKVYPGRPKKQPAETVKVAIQVLTFNFKGYSK